MYPLKSRLYTVTFTYVSRDATICKMRNDYLLLSYSNS